MSLVFLLLFSWIKSAARFRILILPLFNITSKKENHWIHFYMILNEPVKAVCECSICAKYMYNFLFFFLNVQLSLHFIQKPQRSRSDACSLFFFSFFSPKSTCDCFGFVMCTRLHVFMSNFCVEHDGMSSAVHLSLLVHRKHLGFQFFLLQKKKMDQDVIVKCGLFLFSSCSLFFFCYLYCTR